MVRALALETSGDPEQIERIYREEVERLSRRSRISAFVPLLAARRVRDRLRTESAESDPAGDRLDAGH